MQITRMRSYWNACAGGLMSLHQLVQFDMQCVCCLTFLANFHWMPILCQTSSSIGYPSTSDVMCKDLPGAT